MTNSNPIGLETFLHSPIVAEGISAETYMTTYEGRYEWIQGSVVEMSPISEDHITIHEWVGDLLKAYFVHRPHGVLRKDPFVMVLEVIPSRRQPDIQIILGENRQHLTPTAMLGAADICIEIVSAGSEGVDYHDKYAEYEKGGVREYWILDPLQKSCTFYRLNGVGRYEAQSTDPAGIYRTDLLPHFQLDTVFVWQTPLPDYYALGEMVKTWFEA